MTPSKSILVVPLDWGLGHATRCVPLIQYFLDKGLDVRIGGNERTNALLRIEFPQCKFVAFKGYDMTYSKHSSFFILKMMSQTPKMLIRIFQENRRLKQYLKKNSVDFIFSDNRFGLFTSKAISFFMSHQLQVKLPQSVLLERVLNFLNWVFISRYDYVFVPDYPNHILSGELSIPPSFVSPKEIRFLGNLSRLKKEEIVSIRDRVLVILSGPEPQRSILEEIIMKQARNRPETFVVLCAEPERKIPEKTFGNIHLIAHLNKTELAHEMQLADIIISRTGYSTVMDLVQMNLSAILIPTPGQTEQEYLGEYYREKGLFQIESQLEFNLGQAIERNREQRPRVSFNLMDTNRYKTVFDKLWLNLKL